MNPKLILYSRAGCSLCDEMKDVVRRVSVKFPLDLEEIDVDSSAQLQEKYGDEVPLLLIDGRKSFKYRVTAKELAKRVGRGSFWTRSGWVKRGE